MLNGVPDSDQNLDGVDSVVGSEKSVDFQALAKSIVSKLDAAGLKNKVEEIYMGASSEILQDNPKIFFTFMQSVFEVAGEVSYLRDELARFGKEAGVLDKKSSRDDDATKFLVRGVDKLSRLGLEEGNLQGSKSAGMSQQLQEKQFVEAKEKLAALQSVLGQEGDLELAQKYYLSRIVGFFNQVQSFLDEVELFKTAAEKRFAKIDRGTPEGQGILVSLTSLRGRVEELIVSEKSLLAWLETFLNVNKGYIDPGIRSVIEGLIGVKGPGRSRVSLVPKEPLFGRGAVGLTPTPGAVAVDSESGHGRSAQKKAAGGGEKVGSVTAMVKANSQRIGVLKAMAAGTALAVTVALGIVGARKMFSGDPVSAQAAGQNGKSNAKVAGSQNVDAGIGVGELAKAVESAGSSIETAKPAIEPIVEPIAAASAEVIQEIPAKDAGAVLIDAGTVLGVESAAQHKNSPVASAKVPGAVSSIPVAPSSAASSIPAAGVSAAPTAKPEDVPIKPKGDVVNPWGEPEEK